MNKTATAIIFLFCSLSAASVYLAGRDLGTDSYRRGNYALNLECWPQDYPDIPKRYEVCGDTP